MSPLRCVKDLGFKPGIGKLYEASDGRQFVIYCGESREGWDVCPAGRDGVFRFKPSIVQEAPSEQAAAAELADLVESGRV